MDKVPSRSRPKIQSTARLITRNEISKCVPYRPPGSLPYLAETAGLIPPLSALPAFLFLTHNSMRWIKPDFVYSLTFHSVVICLASLSHKLRHDALGKAATSVNPQHYLDVQRCLWCDCGGRSRIITFACLLTCSLTLHHHHPCRVACCCDSMEHTLLFQQPGSAIFTLLSICRVLVCRAQMPATPRLPADGVRGPQKESRTTPSHRNHTFSWPPSIHIDDLPPFSAYIPNSYCYSAASIPCPSRHIPDYLAR